ncbi:hypothetical protein EYZ11_011640 [Aspergillus tanneri]|uniref:Uncharacterized protein n=1 Tax=Aspergillus tanneri TaxID=1220188 RepID=A0A4S3J7L8_9EURO|nr:hypothetical protein EYZ11_011640 [Aspergillus tanneri]
MPIYHASISFHTGINPINFVWGKPAPSLLPVKDLSQALQTVLTDSDAATYALEYADPVGLSALRYQVSSSLSTFDNTPNSFDEICITVLLAHCFTALVVSDDIYDYLSYTSDSLLLRLVDIDHVLFGDQNGGSIARECPSQMGADIVTQFLAAGRLEPHVVDVVRKALGPLEVCIMEARGKVEDYFFWLRLLGTVDAGRVARRRAERENLAVLPGEGFAVVGDYTGLI